jgi:hypothetical protein
MGSRKGGGEEGREEGRKVGVLKSIYFFVKSFN